MLSSLVARSAYARSPESLLSSRKGSLQVAKTPAAKLEGVVEIDEAYVVAGHKGNPAAVAKKGASGAAAG